MKKIIEYILTEVNKVQGEIIITKAIISEYDEKLDDAFSKGDIMQELVSISQNGKAKHEFNEKLSYMDGQLDAYINLLKKLDLYEA